MKLVQSHILDTDRLQCSAHKQPQLSWLSKEAPVKWLSKELQCVSEPAEISMIHRKHSRRAALERLAKLHFWKMRLLLHYVFDGSVNTILNSYSFLANQNCSILYTSGHQNEMLARLEHVLFALLKSAHVWNKVILLMPSQNTLWNPRTSTKIDG